MVLIDVHPNSPLAPVFYCQACQTSLVMTVAIHQIPQTLRGVRISIAVLKGLFLQIHVIEVFAGIYEISSRDCEKKLTLFNFLRYNMAEILQACKAGSIKRFITISELLWILYVDHLGYLSNCYVPLLCNWRLLLSGVKWSLELNSFPVWRVRMTHIYLGICSRSVDSTI